MENDTPLFSHDYNTAALGLTIAIAAMTKTVDTPEFDDAFWRVQQASEKLKQLRAGRNPSAQSESNFYSLVSS